MLIAHKQQQALNLKSIYFFYFAIWYIYRCLEYYGGGRAGFYFIA